MDRYEDIYGEKLHFKERKFTTDTKHSGCQYTISSRPKSMSHLPPILVAPVLLVTLWFLIQITNCHYITSCITSIVALFVMTLLMMLQGQSKAECVTVIQQIGIQVSQHSSNGWWTKPTSRFIPFTEIKDIIINETFYRHKVVYYLALLVKCKDCDNDRVDNFDDVEVVPLFTDIMPRYSIIVIIYKGVKDILIKFHNM